MTLRQYISLILGIVLLVVSLLSVPSKATANSNAGLPGIDPANPQRFVMDGSPWYPAGYYPAIGALTVDQTDYNNYYKTMIDKMAAHGINYFRNVFNMGQPYGNAMTVYLRTGPGNAADSRPKVDLNQFNQDYFIYWREVITYAGSKGIVVQLTIFDSWHNKLWVVESESNPQLEWGLKYDFYNGANNINGVNTANKSEWHSTSHPVYEVQKAMIRQVIDSVGDLPNIVYEISNENYTSASWELALADYLSSYEASKSFPRHLVMPRDLPNHSSAGGSGNNPNKVHQELLANFSLSQPLIADNDGAGEVDPDTRRKKAWAALTAGGHIDYFHYDMYKTSVLNSSDVTDGMKYIGFTRKFIADLSVDLRGMKPSDNLVTKGWCYARSGERYIIYLIAGGSTTVSNLPPNHTATWFNPRDGSHHPASSGPTFTAPDSNDWALYITAPSQPQPPTQPPSPPLPQPSPPKSGQVQIRINFQPSDAPTPVGYLADTGLPYGDRGGGFVFGWSNDNRENARLRNSKRSPDLRADTFNHMQNGSDYIWEIDLPNGKYQVYVMAGDPNNNDSVYKIDAEGIRIVDTTPSRSAYWASGIGFVTINDGKLTVTNASGSENNKINVIEITSAELLNFAYLPSALSSKK